MMPVATPTFRDSLDAPAGVKLGMVRRKSASFPMSSAMPFPSLPMMMSPWEGSGEVYMFSPS